MRTQDGASTAPRMHGRSFVAAVATVLAALALTVGALAAAPSAAWAADDDIASGTCGSCDWVVDADGELTISPSKGTSGSLDYISSASDVPWRPYRTQITSVIIEDGVQTELRAVGLFQGFTSLVTADVSGLDASTYDTSRISYMFYGCTALESVNLDGLNISGVEDLSYLFYNCASLKTLDLSSLETSCATDMDYMFYGCSSLESIDFSGFDASLAEYMQYMFYGCSSLESLDLSSFEVMSVYNMAYMFSGCTSLRKLDLSTFNVSSVTYDGYLEGVFEGCTGLRLVVLGAGYDFPSSYYDGYLPVPYDETYGYGLWQSDDGTIYEDPADIPGQTAATYTAVFEVESGSGEYVPIWEDDTEDDTSGDDADAGDDASGDDGAAGDDASGNDGATEGDATDNESSSDDADDGATGDGDAAADDDAVADDDSSADDGADADDSEGGADTVYEVVSGADQSIEEGDNLTVRVEVDSDKFHGSYEIDGNATSGCSWIARSNGTLSVIIDADILSELELGEHTLTLYFDDGYATTTFTIVAASDDASDGEESDSDEDADTGANGNAAGDDASADDGADADDSTADSTASRTYFTDVPASASGKWYFDAVYALSDLGYITGYDDGSYGVGDNMTRGQFVTILWRIACPDEYADYDNDADNESGLSDVADGKYYTAAVNWGVENEVVTGYSNGKFGVNDSMSFQDMCLIIARYADGEAISGMSSSAVSSLLADFSDADEVSSYARAGMAWCVDEGLVSGNTDGTLDPQSKVTRERVATVLYRAIEEGLV